LNLHPRGKEDEKITAYSSTVVRETLGKTVVLKKITFDRAIKRQQTVFFQHTIPIRQRKIKALRYILNESGEAEGGQEVELNISVDREYVNIELENRTVVYSLKTADVASLFF
jgi:hypothetical protein